MEAVDPVDVMRITTGYYTTLPEEEQARYPTLVALFTGDTGGVDTAASENAYVADLRERLQNEFPEAQAVEVTCLDGTAPRSGVTQVSLTRPDALRLRLATGWVDAIARLAWAQGRWIAPQASA